MHSPSLKVQRARVVHTSCFLQSLSAVMHWPSRGVQRASFWQSGPSSQSSRVAATQRPSLGVQRPVLAQMLSGSGSSSKDR